MKFKTKLIISGIGICIVVFFAAPALLAASVFLAVACFFAANYFGKMYLKRGETFELPFPVTKGASIIASHPEVDYRKGAKVIFYKFQCKINPKEALLSDGSVVPMRVPSEYNIHYFTVGVNRNDNSVEWVHLGDQYHCDKHKTSNCFYIGDLVSDAMSYEFLDELITLLETYNLDMSLNIDHWQNPKFEKLNYSLVRLLEAA